MNLFGDSIDHPSTVLCYLFQDFEMMLISGGLVDNRGVRYESMAALLQHDVEYRSSGNGHGAAKEKWFRIKPFLSGRRSHGTNAAEYQEANIMPKSPQAIAYTRSFSRNSVNEECCDAAGLIARSWRTCISIAEGR